MRCARTQYEPVHVHALSQLYPGLAGCGGRRGRLPSQATSSFDIKVLIFTIPVGNDYDAQHA